MPDGAAPSLYVDATLFIELFDGTEQKAAHLQGADIERILDA